MMRHRAKPVHLVVDGLPAHKTKLVKDLRAIGQGQAHAAFPSGICAGTEPRRAGMELCEAHWRGQNAAAQGRTVKGQDRGAVGQHQERTPTCPVILPSTNCRLYYRLLSKCFDCPLDPEPM